MITFNVYYYHHLFIESLLLWLILHIFSKSNNSNDVLLMFEPLCTLIHIFWNLNFWIMTMWSPLKVSFLKTQIWHPKHVFWYDIKMHLHVFDSLNHNPNPFKMQHLNENFKLNFFDLLSIYFFIIRQIRKFCKVDWK